ncbi:MAG: adenosylmethionine decarboxylase [Proteobacteria bacterium]|nr:MAG: adenosylmethionine decarboxylase [Pseudomonadota bacterium]PIE40495.1 MAG: adenosylmethionine decarboxylase [Gammaproteobacteria bacterium]
MDKKLMLHGFNNLTKSLSFNIYDICYAKSAQHKREYLSYINTMYNAERLTQILTDVVKIIGANILNIARQDYEPHGASVTMLIAEEELPTDASNLKESPGPLPETVVAHIDKSHVTVHTYPESHPDDGISTFRVDLDVSTCGLITPLKVLNYLIHSFESDIVTVDYRVRGFTRDVDGNKHYIDHDINSIQNFLSEDTKEAYEMIDVNVYQENLFHTKMLLKAFELDSYLFGDKGSQFEESEKKIISERLRKEMLEIYYSRNMP